MKILKIFGIVAGLHVAALMLIFANPGCSSTTKPAAVAAAKPEPDPVISAPESAPPSATPNAAPEPAPVVGPFYPPTRPNSTAATALETQPVANVIPATTYTVAKGDSLSKIASKHHLKVAELAAANHMKAGATLMPGQKLIIPAKAGAPASGSAVPETAAPAAAAAGPAASHPAPAAKGTAEATKHIVKPGESLGSIARKYGVRVGDLATANSISDPQKIHPGQELTIPAGGRASGAKASKGPKTAKSEAPAPGASPPPSPAEPPVPAANQDLDAGLNSAPASDIPVIQVEPSEPSSSPSKSR